MKNILKFKNSFKKNLYFKIGFYEYEVRINHVQYEELQLRKLNLS